MKRMKRLLALLLAAMLLLCAGCGNQVVEEKGMKIRAAFLEEPVTLDPAYATTEEERTIVVHLFENLMKYIAFGNVAVFLLDMVSNGTSSIPPPAPNSPLAAPAPRPASRIQSVFRLFKKKHLVLVKCLLWPVCI